jgi:meiotically up-regulated gene 157 (Mug157) protein
LSITMRALTSTSDVEIKKCMQMLVANHGNTGFMHESFHKDDESKFTRKWFAWANTLFGELVMELYEGKNQLLKSL